MPYRKSGYRDKFTPYQMKVIADREEKERRRALEKRKQDALLEHDSELEENQSDELIENQVEEIQKKELPKTAAKRNNM